MKAIRNIFIRYVILLIAAFPNLYLFYLIFTPLTIYPVYFLLNLFFNSSIIGEKIIFEHIRIELVNACIAGSAYYLLLILNLATPKIKKRLKLIVMSFLIFLILNILRIFFLSLLLYFNADFFDITHKVFWYFFSTIFVVTIWFFQVKKFKIKNIPFYSDIKYFSKLIKK